MTISVKTGGKLYLAGEYAILTPGQVALIKNIPIFMTAEISFSETYRISSDMFNHEVTLEEEDKDYALVQETVKVMNRFLESQKISPTPFTLRIKGKMERDGKKLGIGSSGSVTVLVIKAMAELYNLELSKDYLFKLASYVLLARGDNGSMGDIACIAYEELIFFQSFDRVKMSQDLALFSLEELLKKDWGYIIRPVRVGLKVELLVGWTQKPSISKDMIRKVTSSIGPEFLKSIRELVSALEKALILGDKQRTFELIEKNSQLLKDLHPAIYSSELVALVDACHGLNAVGKSSGSGGGDCGIVFAFDDTAINMITERWEKSNIIPLYREEIDGK